MVTSSAVPAGSRRGHLPVVKVIQRQVHGEPGTKAVPWNCDNMHQLTVLQQGEM